MEASGFRFPALPGGNRFFEGSPVVNRNSLKAWGLWEAEELSGQ